MQRKPKKPPRCSVCKKSEGRFKSGLKRFCGPECGTVIALSNLEKKKKQEVKEYRQETKKLREKYESLPDVIEKVKRACNEWVRQRDWDLPCISCGKDIEKVGTNYHAGHFISYGSKYKYSPLRFDGRNINGQCSDCNAFNGGRPREYEQGLINRFGQSYVDEIMELKRQADSGELEPITLEHARELIKHFKQLTKELKQSRR